MANDSDGTGLLGFMLGGVVVVMAIMAFVVYGGEGTGPKTVNLDLPNTVSRQ